MAFPYGGFAAVVLNTVLTSAAVAIVSRSVYVKGHLPLCRV